MDGYKEIPEYSNYAIDKNGNVLSKKFNKILHHCISKTGIHTVSITKNKQAYRFPVSKLLAMTFLDNPNYCIYVNYKDGDPTNFSLDNIYWSEKVFRKQRGKSMRINPKNLSVKPTISETKFFQKQCQINFQISKEDFRNSLIFSSLYKEKCFESDWNEFKNYIKESYKDKKGKQIRFSSQQIDLEAKEMGVNVENVCTIDRTLIERDAIIFVTYANINLILNFNLLNIHPQYVDSSYHPAVLNIVYRILKSDFIQAMKDANFYDEYLIDYHWNAFQSFLDRYYDVSNQGIDTIRLNSYIFSQKANELGHVADMQTISINHVIENDEYDAIDVAMACTCHDFPLTINNDFNMFDQLDEMEKHVNVDENFVWTQELLSKLNFQFPYPETKTPVDKNMKMTFHIHRKFFVQQLKNAGFETLDSEKNTIMFNAWSDYFANQVHGIDDLSKFGMNKTFLTDFVKRWGYEPTNIQLRQNEVDIDDINDDVKEVEFTIITKSIVKDRDDERDEEIIRSIQTNLIRVDGVKKDLSCFGTDPFNDASTDDDEDYNYFDCYINFDEFRLAVDEIGMYDANTIKRTWAYLARFINNNNVLADKEERYSRIGFYEGWSNDICENLGYHQDNMECITTCKLTSNRINFTFECESYKL